MYINDYDEQDACDLKLKRDFKSNPYINDHDNFLFQHKNTFSV